jgi:hypothetical protein
MTNESSIDAKIEQGVLNDDQKRHFDATKTLRDSAWESFDRRRGFEWKLSFGLWTALGALLGALATGKVSLVGKDEQIAVWVACVVVVALHGYWSYALAGSNRADLKKSYVYEKELRNALNLSSKVKNDLDAIVEPMSERNAAVRNWGHITQVLITLILAGASVVTSWIRG